MQVQTEFRATLPPSPAGFLGHDAIRRGVTSSPIAGKRLTMGGGAAIDPGARLVELAPILRALAGPSIEFDLELGFPNARTRIDPVGFDATVLELVVGACIAGARRIVVRNRKIGARLWVLVCDDGDHRPSGTEAPRIHDFGLGSHGRVRAKYGAGPGRAVALTLPTILSLADGLPLPRHFVSPRKPEEKKDEKDRQPVAA